MDALAVCAIAGFGEGADGGLGGGAELGGGGGADGGGGGGITGDGAAAGAGECGVDGFREPGGGGGFGLRIGRCPGVGGGLLAGAGGGGGAAADGGGGGTADGGFGAEGALAGLLTVAPMYEESGAAPVSTPPPVFLNFGMPFANKPPIGGADSAGDAGSTAALLALDLFPGTGGAPPGGLSMPGTGGALPIEGAPPPPELTFPPTRGAERSFVTVFLSFAPFLISPSKAF